MSQIKAKVVQDSAANGIRLVTMELEYPRFIHSEFMTHRMFSRNCASSRAIPIQAMLNTITNDPAVPVYWGKNQAGMQANEELEDNNLVAAKSLWSRAMWQAINYSSELADSGLHKQIANRITEPWQTMKTVVSATEWSNFFELRNHKDAQPEIRELAVCMVIAINNSDPIPLSTGEWHVPYTLRYWEDDCIRYTTADGTPITKDEALIVSASCCAQVSYRKNDDSLEKALAIYNRLVGMNPKHSSPFEHQATPIKERDPFAEIPEGITHKDRNGYYWSGNFRGWIQHRHLI